MRRQTASGDGIALKPEEFRLLRDLFASRAGLNFGPEARFAIERRLRERLLVLKLHDFADYHHYLRFGAHAAEEWDEALDLLTTNETYFFREERQLRGFAEELLPMFHAQMLARGKRRLVIWSAGCSTGEEAYTIAILVHQSGLFFPRRSTILDSGPSPSLTTPSAFGAPAESPSALWDVRIYGSDISRRCVAAARRGTYTEASFRATPENLRRSCFRACDGGWQVTEPIRQLCHFGQMNLLDEDRTRVFGKADVIFCRNVLIYFDTKARKTAIEVLYDRLNPGGVLLLGHSESLLNVSTAFELLHLREDLVYRKPISAQGPNPALDDPT
ncbi:MAG TPA: protein-glutamate O-methyltransferase CheR [Polyangiaceae bacterium]|jgi:chemotaxis protein methyltransferase CheR|nr:protein-glutamate O-methyltransferase CheR [Polyangiaceae bacterium]